MADKYYFSPRLLELWDDRCQAAKAMHTAEELMRNIFLAALRKKVINSREYKILKMRFYWHKTLEEVAKELYVTRERIRQMEAKALAKIKGAVKRGNFDDKEAGAI